MFYAVLSQRVFSTLNDFLRDLLAEFDGVEGFVLCQAAEDCELGAQHVAFGDGSDDFLRGGFDFLERLR